MADIAPLGFAVDTDALENAAEVAHVAAVKITGVADAADKVSEATKKAAESTSSSASQAVANTRTQAAEMQRIHEMVGRSLDQLGEKAKQTNTHLGGTIPKNLSAQAFEHDLEMRAAKRMGPTEADIERQKRATAEAEKWRKELIAITAALDPAAAKIARLDLFTEKLGKSFDAGKFKDNPQEYYTMLDAIQKKEDALQNPPPGRRDTHHSFLGEVGRTLTYGIPRFGREARRLVYSAESEQQGGGLGAGIAGFSKLAAGAAVGMLAVEAFRYISELPAKIAEANDQAEKMERRLSSLDIGGLKAAENTADKLHMSVKGAADAMVEFHNAFTRFAADQPSQDKAFAAILSAGRIGGLDEQSRTQSASQFATMTQKPFVSGGDIQGLAGSNPVLAQALAQQFGAGDVGGLQSLASTGKITGEKLFEAAQAVNQRLERENSKIPANAKELEQKAKDSAEKLDATVNDHVVGFFYRLSDKINTGLVHLFGGGDSGGIPPGVKPVARDQTLPNALTLAEGFQGQAGTRRDLQASRDQLAQALERLQKVNGGNGDQARMLQGGMHNIDLQLHETPFGRIEDEVNDLQAAFGHGSGQGSGLIGVWQQAIQVQREQEKQGLATAASLGQIVEQLLALKRAQQAVTDEDDLRKLKQAIDTTQSQRAALGDGGYAQRLAAFRASQRAFDENRAWMNGSGSAGNAPSSATGTGGNLSGFLDAIRAQESGGRDYDAHGRPLRSSAGALYAMQVLPSTAARPGFGIEPAHSQSADEYDRVGIQYATALFNRFGGDASKAAAAYNAGLGHMGRGRAYAQSILRRMGLGGAAGAAGSGGVGDLGGQLKIAQANQFGLNEALQAETSINGLGISARNTGAQAALLRSGGTEGDLHRLQIEQQITEAVKNLPPAYRAAMAAAMQLNDVEQERLKAAQKTAEIMQQAHDDERLARATESGDPARVKALELQLQIEQVRRSAAPKDEKDRQEGALNSAGRSSALRNAGQVIGAAANDNKLLREQFQLQRYTGEELTLQQKIMEANRQIEADTTNMTKEEVQARKDAVDLLITENEHLSKQLDLVNTIKGSYHFMIDSISSSWSKMFGDMERTGHLHVKTLLRGIEDGFYGMLDRIEQKLVVSPLMNVFDKLLNSLTNSLLGGPSIGLPDLGATAPVGINLGNTNLFGGSARGNIFGPRGMVPFARGDMFNTPTRFAMGGGATGIAGEGPGLYEAIMPLKRGPDGRLGVSTHGMQGGGGGGVQVVINDHRGANAAAVEIQERETGNGQRRLDITLRDQQRSNVGSGRLDADMRSSYGISRPAARR